MEEYVNGLIDNPEMYPRENALKHRAEELQINWATMQAIEKGTCKVRAIAPPLQLTGDENLDQTTVDRILLVADDLSTNESFLDVYEVRVGPDPKLVTVEPGATADSIAQADLQLADEKLALLRMDQAEINADLSFASNYVATATNRLGEITAAATNLLNKSGQAIVDLQSQLTQAETNLAQQAEEVKKQEAAYARCHTNSTSTAGESKDAFGKESNAKPADPCANLRKNLQDAKNAQDTLEKNLADLNSKITAAEGIELQAKQQLTAVRDFLDKRNQLKSASAWYDVQVTFWQTIRTEREHLMQVTAEHLRYAISSTAAISFRPAALAKLNEITVEVIRKSRHVALAGEPAVSTPSTGLVKRIEVTLGQIDGVLGNIRVVLMMDNRRVEARSRLALMSHYAAQFPSLKGRLEACLELTNPAASLITPEQKELLNTLGQKIANSPVLTQRFDSEHMLRGTSVLKEVEALEENIAKAVTMLKMIPLPTAVSEIKASGGAPTLGQDTSPITSSVTTNSTFALIESGDLAVFRFNVLRGVVKTTAFLLADDDASLLFGRHFADLFFAAQATFRNPNNKPILIYGNTMRLVVRMTSAYPTQYVEDGSNLRRNWWGTFEPLDYDAVRRMLTQSNENSW